MSEDLWTARDFLNAACEFARMSDSFTWTPLAGCAVTTMDLISW